jgi:ATP synthase protein I
MDDREAPDPLKRLGEDIEKAAGRPNAAGHQAGANGSSDGMGAGMTIGLELVVAVAVGAGIGWLIDRGLGSMPWGLITGFFLGVAVGMWNVFRAVLGPGRSGGK